MNMHPPQQHPGLPIPPTPHCVPPPPPYIPRPSYTLMSPFQSPMAPVRSAQPSTFAQPSVFATPKNGPRPRYVQQTQHGYPPMISDNNPLYVNAQQPFLQNPANPSPRLIQAWYMRKVRIERKRAAKMKVDKLKRQLKNMTREYIEACEEYAHALEDASAVHELITWTGQAQNLEATAAQPDM